MSVLEWLDSVLNKNQKASKVERMHDARVASQEERTRKQREELSRIQAELRSYGQD